MIGKGNLHSNGTALARYLVAGKGGERAELVELRGFAAADIETAFLDVEVQAYGTRCQKPFFHCYTRLAPGEALSREQWLEVADRQEKRLGFTGQPRAVSFHHQQDGSTHMHIAWSRIDAEQMRAIDPGLYKLRLKDLCRQMEKDLGLQKVRNERKPEDRARAADRKEFEQSRRLGTDLKAIRNTILDCFERSDSGKAFTAALAMHGLVLANGDRRDCFIVVDREGGHHALNKKLTGHTLEQTRKRLGDIDRTQLPSVEGAQTQQRIRQAAQEARQRPDLTAAIEEQRQREQAAQPSSKGAAHGSEVPLQTPTPKAPPERPLSGTAAEIRLAWSLSRTASELEDALAVRGVSLAAVAPAEAYASERRAAFAKAIGRILQPWQEGEIVAVDARGTVYRLNERTTGNDRAAIEGRLAGVDRASLMNATDTKEALRAASSATWRSERQAEREKVRPPSLIENRIADCAQQAALSGAHVLQDVDGRRLSGADILAQRLMPEEERTSTSATVYGAEAFAARLEEAGIAIVRVTDRDAAALTDLRRDEDKARQTVRGAKPWARAYRVLR